MSLGSCPRECFSHVNAVVSQCPGAQVVIDVRIAGASQPALKQLTPPALNFVPNSVANFWSSRKHTKGQYSRHQDACRS
jgi:hypothetical protein